MRESLLTDPHPLAAGLYTRPVSLLWVGRDSRAAELFGGEGGGRAICAPAKRVPCALAPSARWVCRRGSARRLRYESRGRAAAVQNLSERGVGDEHFPLARGAAEYLTHREGDDDALAGEVPGCVVFRR